MRLNEKPDPEFIFNSTLLTLIGKLGIAKAAIYNISETPYRLEAYKGKKIETDEIDNAEFFKKEIEVNDEFINYLNNLIQRYEDIPNLIIKNILVEYCGEKDLIADSSRKFF